jgi:hypothetical protein
MKKPAIPATIGLPAELARVLEPLKQNVELMTGARPGMTNVTQLPTTAALSDVIAKVNEILSRLNQSG